MIQHRFSAELVARGRPPAPSRWHLTYRDGDSLEILAEIDFRPETQDWRLRSRVPALRGRDATWSSSGYPAAARPSTVPAWLQREITAQLFVWALEALKGRDPSHARERDGEAGS